MKIIHDVTSTNGRYGVTIVSEDIDSLIEPTEGNLVHLGKIEGKDTFKFIKESSEHLIMIASDIEVLTGSIKIADYDLQSNNYFSIIGGRKDFFAFIEYGYKRRSSKIRCFKDGKEVNVPSAILAAMGIIDTKHFPVVVILPDLREEELNNLHLIKGE